MNILCRLGFHNFVGLYTERIDNGFHEMTFHRQACARCRLVQDHLLPEVLPSDEVEFALRREAMARRDEL